MSPDRAELLVLSNRGPLTFARNAEGALVGKRAGGGLVVTLGPGVTGSGARWLAATATPEDRAAAAAHMTSAGFDLHHVDVEPDDYRAYYDVIANGTLWFCLHGLWDLPRRPRFDRRWRQAWATYQRVNELFAAAAAEQAAPGATVLIHDYHLALVPGALARTRPDVRSVMFLHTPWCSPAELAVLPDVVAAELVAGLAAADACGFHSTRWAEAFEACCAVVLGETRAKGVSTFAAPAAADADDLRSIAGSAACAREGEALDALVGDRQLIVRVDRMEPSKNVLRGFWAFDELLEARPDLRGRVCFAAMVYPSRQGLADYLAYGQEVQGLAQRVNDRWGTAEWTPVVLCPEDNYARSVAALRRYDVLLVNPVRDGLNLVAKEGPLVNERSGTLVLSRQAGSWDELGAHAFGVNPFDISQTAGALGAALDTPAEERATRAARLLRQVESRTPMDWWGDLLDAQPAR